MQDQITAVEMARLAFYGDPEYNWIADAVNDSLAYEIDGVWYPGNGATLAEYVLMAEAIVDAAEYRKHDAALIAATQ